MGRPTTEASRQGYEPLSRSCHHIVDLQASHQRGVTGSSRDPQNTEIQQQCREGCKMPIASIILEEKGFASRRPVVH